MFIHEENSDTPPYRYEGEWDKKKNLKHGRGTQVFSDGKLFIGNFKNDLFSGRGRVIYPDGEAYTGEWKAGECHGKGTYHYTDGSKYEGDWKNDIRDGNG
jgi:hypothetical protein